MPNLFSHYPFTLPFQTREAKPTADLESSANSAQPLL